MAPLTSTQRRIVLVLSILVALTRLLAVSKSLWDWDEGLFTAAVRDFDAANDRPHPPGYPLFVAAARLFFLIGVPEFRALQLVVFAGAIALFPATFFLAREMGFRFRTAIGGAAIFAFLPNVWYYGGTGFSDVPAIALALVASVYLLRGRNSRRDYLLGTLVLAISLGVRPQNLLIGLVPGVLATWRRVRDSWRTVLLAALLGAVIVGITYTGAALASHSVEWYVASVRDQADYVKRVDSWRNPGRPPLVELSKAFLIKPVQEKDLAIPLLAFGTISLVSAAIRRRKEVWLLVATFTPAAIFSWLNLDVSAVSRYAVAYVAMHALLAADGIDVLVSLVERRYPRFARAMAIALPTLVVITLAAWMWRPLQTVRTTHAPPASAMVWLTKHVPRGETIVVHAGLRPQAMVYLRDYQTVVIDHNELLPELPRDRRIFYVDDRRSGMADAMEFTRDRGKLWDIARPRNFEASITPVTSTMRFGGGWHAEETDDVRTWRWMTAEGTVWLPPLQGTGELRLSFFVPNDSLPSPPTVTLTWNGAVVDRFVARGERLERTWVLQSRVSENELRISTSATANPMKLRGVPDARDLGLRLDSFSWKPKLR